MPRSECRSASFQRPILYLRDHVIGGPAVGLKRKKLVLARSRVPDIVSVMKKRRLQPPPTRIHLPGVRWRLQSE